MKKKILKVITAWALILCMTIPTILSVQAEENVDVISDAIDKGTFVVQHHTFIDDYREGEFGAPDAPEGYSDYLFAGWYEDENCETARDSEYKSGEAYAKYVHKDVLGVKAQVLSGTYFSTETSDIRFVSTVDSLDYQEVGFNIKMYGDITPYTTGTVYSKLYAVGSADVVLEEYTPDLFHETSEYFFACTVTGVTNDAFDYGIQVAPYWITLDGTTVQAEVVTKSVSNGYMYKAMDADITVAGTIALTEGYKLLGGSLGGKYYYLVSTNGESTTVDQLASNTESTGWNTTPKATNTLSVSGTNDITYNGTTKNLVMVSGSAVNYVDRVNLTALEGSANIGFEVASIKYNKNHDKYVAMSADGIVKVLDSAFAATGVATTVPTDLNDYTAQSVTADDSYIFLAFSKDTDGVISNKIVVYNWEGEYVTTIVVALTEHTIETIDIANNTMYAAGATESEVALYNIDVLKTFDIIYNLDGGTTESPIHYTKKSGEIEISEPTRYGYDFMGWSEETVSLSEITWKDFLAAEANGNDDAGSSGWDDAQNTGGLYLADGLKHTLMYGSETYKTSLSALRWRLFQTSDLVLSDEEIAKIDAGELKTSFATATFTMEEDDMYPYAVLSLKTPANVELDKLSIKSEFVKPLTLNYTVDETKSIVVLDNFTKGFINTGDTWSVRYNHGTYPDAVYSDEIELTGGVTYTLTNTLGSGIRWRFISEDGSVSNVSNSGTYTPEADCTVRVMLLEGRPEYRDAIIKAGSTGDRIYTATWIRNNFKVQYDANGGEGTMEDSIHEFADEKQLSTNAFVREGYAFTGWNTVADGTGNTYADGATVTNLTTDESITLYAQWTNEDVFTINYNLEGGQLADSGINPTSYAKTTESFTLTAPTKEGYTFAGWKETISPANWKNASLTKDGIEETNAKRHYCDYIYLQGGREYTFNGGSYTGNIRWRMYSTALVPVEKDYAQPTYTWDEDSYVRFLLVASSATSDEVRGTITLTSNTLSNSDPTTITVNKGTTGNITYTALWNYTVEYNSNVDDDSVVGTMENSVHVTDVASALNANEFTREGYAFAGWNTEADGTGDTYADGATVTDLTTDNSITLYAQWTPIYTITYDYDGGALAEGESNPTEYTKNTESFTLLEPTKEGYTFAGWEETVSFAGNWISGNLTKEGKTGSSSVRHYSNYVYLEGGRAYTLNGFTGTLRWRIYGTDYTPVATDYGKFTYTWDSDCYVRFLLANSTVTSEEVRNAITLTSSASSITVNKGTTGNIAYKALWTENATE